MAVSRSFLHLNYIFETAGFPQGKSVKRSGEVVSIELLDAHPIYSLGDTGVIARSKRKSCSVSVSSNAFWNHRNLLTEVIAWESRNGICRSDRRQMREALYGVVSACYQANCESGNQMQYFQVIVERVIGGTMCVIKLDDLHIGENGCGYPLVTVFCGEDLQLVIEDVAPTKVVALDLRHSLRGLSVKYLD